MSRFLFPLRLLALLATLHIGRCQSGCTGAPAGLQFFVLPLQEGAEAGFPTISAGQANSDLRAFDFLEDDVILELIQSSDAIFRVPLSTLSQFSSSTCNIPLSQACRLYPCGCEVSSGRRLLQCFPIFFCRRSNIGTAPGAGFTPIAPIAKFPNTLVGVCVGGTCTLFKIEQGSLGEFEIALDMACPGITAGGAPPETTLSAPLLGSPPPPEIALTTPLISSPPPPPLLNRGQLISSLRRRQEGRGRGFNQQPQGVGVGNGSRGRGVARSRIFG
ncbi:hypothetical protein BSKO_06836 [Bryopsis sp. KO-2023]|nr:hypothetical protein BSKO_06836 [Bryopsis sp. KO-2023]